MSDERAMSINDWLELFNGKYAVVKIGSDAYVLDETRDTSVEFMTFKGFKDFHSNISVRVESLGGPPATVAVAPLWLKWTNRRTYNEVTFKPEQDVLEDQYNLWRGFPVDAKQGDCQFYWNHVRDVICNGSTPLYQYVRKWLAHAVQKPWQLPEVALVMQGGRGVGKGRMADHFVELFGPAGIMVNSMDQLAGRFQGHLKDKIVVFADEAIWGGHKKEESVLKTLITSPSRPIEMKGKDILFLPNYTRLLIASNNDWVVPAGLDERRYVFLKVEDAHREDYTYFSQIEDQMTTGGLEALLWDLQNEHIEGWHPRQKPQVASELALLQKVKSMRPHENFIFEVLMDGRFETFTKPIKNRPGMYLSEVAAVYCAYVDFCKQSNMHTDSSVSFGMLVWKKLIPSEGVVTKSGKRYHVVPSLRKCRKHWEESIIHQEVSWETAPRYDGDVERDLANRNVVEISKKLSENG